MCMKLIIMFDFLVTDPTDLMLQDKVMVTTETSTTTASTSRSTTRATTTKTTTATMTTTQPAITTPKLKEVNVIGKHSYFMS